MNTLRERLARRVRQTITQPAQGILTTRFPIISSLHTPHGLGHRGMITNRPSLNHG